MAAPLLTSPAAGLRIRIDGVRRAFDNGVVALDGIELDVAPGEFLAILGPSGCGKSTLLRLIAGLDQPQQGIVEVSSSALSPRADSPRSDTAYVFQDAHLLPWRNVLQNVALPLEFMRLGSAQRRAASVIALEQVGLADTIDRYPSQLSGGQRMRVSLARAMVTNPRLLLLDEPFAALDEITRQKLDEQLRALWKSRPMTVVFVTHSTPEAAYLARRAVVLTRRPGKIIADHPVDLPDERIASIRGTPQFARQTRLLYDALEQGGA